MPRGLPVRVDDPQWQEWLEQAPVTAGMTLLDAMRTSRQSRRWLAAVPPFELITPAERRSIGDDLLHLCEQLLEEVRARSSAGGIAVGVSFAGGMLSLIFPPAAPAVLLGTLVIGGAFASNAYQQLRRQQELDGTIQLMRNLAWTLRQ